MERIKKGSDLPKKSGGHQASNKNIRTPILRKGHQLYINFCWVLDLVRVLENDVAHACLMNSVRTRDAQ